MGVVVRQSFKATVASYIGVAIGAFNLLILFTAFLKPEEIGLRDVMLGAGLWFATFSQLGIASVTIRFFPYFENDKEKHNGFLVLLLIAPLIGFGLMTALLLILDQVIIEFYKEGAQLLTEYYYYLLPLIFFMAYVIVLEAYSRVHLRVTIPVFLREVFLKLFTTLMVILYARGIIDFELFVQLLVLSHALQCLFLIIYIKSLGKWYIRRPNLKAAGKSLREIYVYSIWMIFGTLGIAGADLIDKFMLSKFDLAMTGIYSIAFFMAVVVEMPRRSLSQIVTPLIARADKDDDLEEMGTLYKKTALNQFLAGALIFCLIWVSVDHIFQIIPNSEIYSRGKWVVLFIGLAKLVDMSTGPNSEIIINSRYFRFNLLLITMLALLSILTNYLLIPIYGLTGAALATCLTIVIYNITKLWYVKRKYNLLPFSKQLNKVMIIFLLILGISFLLPGIDGTLWIHVGMIALKSTIIGGIFILALYRLRLSDDAISAVASLRRLLSGKK